MVSDSYNYCDILMDCLIYNYAFRKLELIRILGDNSNAIFHIPASRLQELNLPNLIPLSRQNRTSLDAAYIFRSGDDKTSEPVQAWELVDQFFSLVDNSTTAHKLPFSQIF